MREAYLIAHDRRQTARPSSERERAAELIHACEEAFGRTLSTGERIDLLLDNMPDLKSSDAIRLVAEVAE